MPADNEKRWWKGSRGEWLVVIQVILMTTVFFGPRTMPGQLKALILPSVCRTVSWPLMISGFALFLAGLVRLGKGLTPLPRPSDGAPLIETGPFALVRHPMYSGGLIFALGWALFVRSWMTVGYVVVLFIFLELKSRCEEKWLMEKFPTYRDYQKRVRKLIPFIY
jgi:protein-S-isoprenylcysteine O-methyltransferase Ste14